MGIPLDASKDKAAAPAPDAGQTAWDGMEDETPNGTEPETKADPTRAESPPPAENATHTTGSDLVTPQPVPGPTPADAVTAARGKVRKLLEREERLKRSLNEVRRGMDRAVMEVGRAVMDHPDFMPPAATEAPVVKTAANWKNAPIAMLELSKSIEAILSKRHGLASIGQIADYIEANGSMTGLEGITEKRCEQITTAFDAFLES